MTTNQLNSRIDHYRKAFEEGKITGHEFEAFMQALIRIKGR